MPIRGQNSPPIDTGETVTHPAGKDTVAVIEITDPAKPKVVVNLPLMNTITGPSVNLAIKRASGMAINRAGSLALVANRAENSVTVLAINRNTGSRHRTGRIAR